MVCIVAGQNEQHLSGFDLVSLICISFNMPFFSSKMSALINSSWNKLVSVIPVAKSLRRFFPRGQNEVFGLRNVFSCRSDVMQIQHSLNLFCCFSKASRDATHTSYMVWLHAAHTDLSSSNVHAVCISPQSI